MDINGSKLIGSNEKIGPNKTTEKIRPSSFTGPFALLQSTGPVSQHQISLFSSLHRFDKEVVKEAMAKTLENLIRGEGSTSKRYRQPSRCSKRL